MLPKNCQNPECGKDLGHFGPLTAHWLEANKHLCHTCYHRARDEQMAKKAENEREFHALVKQILKFWEELDGEEGWMVKLDVMFKRLAKLHGEIRK